MNNILRAAGTRSGTSPPLARIPVSKPSSGRHVGYACRVDPPEMADELASSVVRAAASVAGAIPAADAVLGSFVGIAALIRSVSVHEGRLLEEAMTVIARRNPDLVVLERGVRLPVTAAALEAVRHNKFAKLSGLTFDADAKARETYAPDLVVVKPSRSRCWCASHWVLPRGTSRASGGRLHRGLADLVAECLDSVPRPPWRMSDLPITTSR